MSQPIKAWSKKADLLKLPFLGWGEDRGWWACLLIVPARTKHDSGFAHIAVIGVDENSMAHAILAYPDVLSLPAHSPLMDDPNGPLRDYPALTFDAYHPTGTLRLFSHEYEFTTSQPISSVDIKIRRRAKQERLSAAPKEEA